MAPIVALPLQIDTLEVPPDIALQVLTLGAQGRVEIDALADAIGQNSALSAHLMRVANSPFYCPSEPISDLRRALHMVGPEQALKTALWHELQAHLQRMHPDAADGPTWNHAIGVAIASRVVAAKWHPELVVPAFTAGLVHDLGKWVLAWAVGPEYTDFVHTWTATETARAERERQRYGIDHVEAGAQLGAHWQLPAPLTQGIRHHHGPVPDDLDADTQAIIRIVRLGDRLAHAAGVGFAQPAPPPSWANIPENPGFPEAALHDLFIDFVQQYEEERARMEATSL